MRVGFRVDSSTRVGSGHLMRCLTLANELRRRGAAVCFISREDPGHLIGCLQDAGHEVRVLLAQPANPGTPFDHSALPRVLQEQDATATLAALGDLRLDWLVVDHYGLDEHWEKSLRAAAKKILVIDDLANRNHDCDLLLDQNYHGAAAEARYTTRLPQSSIRLLGPRYALLQPQFAQLRAALPLKDGLVNRVLVFFGGSDSTDQTSKVLMALSSPEFAQLAVDVVIGINHANSEKIADQVAARPGTVLHRYVPTLAGLMAQADLAIGAGGATTWERMCLGLPTVVISTAENQRPASEALAEAKLIHYAGHFADIKIDHLKQLLQALIQSTQRLTDLIMQNRLQVDGLGALRLVEMMKPSAAHEIRLRPACEEDIVLYYNWANDPEVRTNAINASPIPWATHQARFANKLHDVNSRLFVLEAAGLPVGQIRFDREVEDARVDYSLDSIVRGRGWGSRMVALGADLMRQIEPVRLRAEIKFGNEGSSAVFLRMRGTEMSNGSEERGTGRSIAILSDRTSWMNEYIRELQLEWLTAGHRVLWVHDKKELRRGDLCFYLSCGQVVPANILFLYRHNLVVHESDLPRGKGWSPLTWQILEGNNRIPVTLFEAAEKVDSGVIYAQEWMEIEGHELIDELREAQAKATIKLCKRFVEAYPQILDQAREQAGEESFYPRRREADSELDPMQSIEAQFDQLRVVDNQRYPAFFIYRHHRYSLRIEKVEKS